MTDKEKCTSFVRWVFDNKLVPNSSFLWFDHTKSRESVRFFTIDELYDICKSSQSIEDYANLKNERLSSIFNSISQ